MIIMNAYDFIGSEHKNHNNLRQSASGWFHFYSPASQCRPIALSLSHSVRRDSTGFAIAALIAWKLTVIKAMNTANAPAIANIHQLICTL